MSLWDEIELTTKEKMDLQRAADRCGMTVIEFSRLALIVQTASILGDGSTEIVEHPWGDPNPDKSKPGFDGIQMP